MYYLTFGGVTILCNPFVDNSCISTSEKFIVWFRLLFTTPVCAWEKLRVGAWHNWEGTL